MIVEFLVIICVVLVALLFWSRPENKKNGKLLPGPKPIPILGNVLQIGFKPHIRFTEWAQKYGGIYEIKLGFKSAVIISNHKVLKDIFSESASTGRLPENCVMMEISQGPNGIINSEGKTWEQQRKFTVRTLRSLGFAKTSMESMILDEVQTILEWFRKREGYPISGVRVFNAPVINSLWRIVSGERCEWEKNPPPILKAADDFFSAAMNVSTNGVFFAPVLKAIAPGFFGWTRFVNSVNQMWRLFTKSIEDHKKSYNSSDLRDFIDHNISEIENETDKSSSFYKETGYKNMVAVLFDLFLAGPETSSHLLSWSLLYLSEYKEKQEKLQKEIDTVLGSRLPSLVDRNSMPYTEAVIFEVLRIATAAPFTPHRLKADFVYQDYHLSEGTFLFGNIYGAHHDRLVWGDPSNFRPERFLSTDETQIVQNEGLVPFSEGKRRCLGETLGKDTLFLFLTAIFQEFNVLPDPALGGKQASFEADFGALLSPKPFKVVFQSRKK